MTVLNVVSKFGQQDNLQERDVGTALEPLLVESPMRLLLSDKLKLFVKLLPIRRLTIDVVDVTKKYGHMVNLLVRSVGTAKLITLSKVFSI